MLAGAAGLVGIAIALDSGVGRALNGVGGVMWLIGAGVLLREARRARLDIRVWAVVGVTVVALSTLLSPRDLGAASAGFFVGGWVVAVLGRRSLGRLSAVGLLPALWLPTHLAAAAVRALYRTIVDEPATLRADPPPTAALVPLAMVLMAFVGGQVGSYLSDRRSSGLHGASIEDAGKPTS